MGTKVETGSKAFESGRDVARGGTPVADRIRERIRKARGRFHANDNIAAYLEEGELAQLRIEVTAYQHGSAVPPLVQTAQPARRASAS